MLHYADTKQDYIIAIFKNIHHCISSFCLGFHNIPLLMCNALIDTQQCTEKHAHQCTQCTQINAHNSASIHSGLGHHWDQPKYISHLFFFFIPLPHCFCYRPST